MKGIGCAHSPVESGADCYPQVVFLALAGKKRLLGILPRTLRCGKTMRSEMAQRRLEHPVAAKARAIVISGVERDIGREPPGKGRNFPGLGSGKMDGHRGIVLRRGGSVPIDASA